VPWDETSADPVWAEIQRAIGSLMVSASSLEGTVRSVLLNMMGGPHWRRTGLVIEGYSTSQMRERCIRLAQVMLEGELRDDLLKWLKEVESAQSERNKIVHGEWTHLYVGPDQPSVGPVAQTRRLSKRSQYGLETRTDAHSAEDVHRLSGRLSKAMLDGTTLIMELQLWAQLERQEGGVDLSPWTRPAPDLGFRRDAL
jgi:hypothetical protein